ncbi:MAG: hypothetical protein ACXWN4_03905 [Candidatus Limnocylindrales bacterium]
MIERYSSRTRLWVQGRLAWAGATRPGRDWAGLTRRTRGMLVVAGAGAIVAMVAAGLAFGPLAGGSAPTPRPSWPVAAAISTSPSATPSSTVEPSASPSITGGEPSVPEPSPTEDDSPLTPAVLASVDCSTYNSSYGSSAVAGNLLYVSCGFDQKIVAIDLTTDKIVRTYPVPKEIGKCAMACVMPAPDTIIVDGGLWIHWNDRYLQRLDLDSGQTTTSAQEAELIGDAFGWIWVQGKTDTAWAVGPQGPLPDSLGARTSNWNRFSVACGQLWEEFPGQDGTTVLAPVDHESGLATEPHLTVPKTIDWSYVSEFDSACWLVGSSFADHTGIYHIVRLSDFTAGSTPCFAPSWLKGDHVPFDLDGTDWVWDGSVIRQIDMVTGKTYGRGWTMPQLDAEVLVANGQVWASAGDQLERLDIPLSPIPNQTPLTPIVCGEQSPSPE